MLTLAVETLKRLTRKVGWRLFDLPTLTTQMISAYFISPLRNLESQSRIHFTFDNQRPAKISLYHNIKVARGTGIAGTVG